MGDSGRYLIRTEHGEVVVEINDHCRNALEQDLLILRHPEAGETFVMETPLRAFGAKMVDIIQMIGTGDFDPGEKMRELMIREKATADLKRIERWARDNPADGKTS